MNGPEKPKMNRRIMINFFMLFSFAILPVSGVLLHFADHGDPGAMKTFSRTFHNLAAVIFTITVLIHLKYNWRSILSQVKGGKDRLIRYPRELSVVLSVMIVMFLLAAVHVFQGHP